MPKKDELRTTHGKNGVPALPIVHDLGGAEATSRKLKEIEKFSCDSDKPILRWLFSRYREESQWYFVANYISLRYGALSYQINRVWKPTKEGYALFSYEKHCAKCDVIKRDRKRRSR